jgi:Zn-finger nucleic acid-binding protein
MEIEGMEVVQLELKYCETCGGLWLRVKGSNQVECAACMEREQNPFARLRKKPSSPRLPGRCGRAVKSMRNDERECLVTADWGNA